MKRVLGIVASCLLVACTAEGSAINDNADTAAQINAADENTELVKALYDAFANNDGETISGLVTDDVVWIEAPNTPYADNSPYVGKDAVFGDLFVKLGTEWTGYTVTPENFVAQGDTVVTFGKYSGKFNATGRELSTQFVHVWTIRDNKIAQFQQYTDTAHFTSITQSE